MRGSNSQPLRYQHGPLPIELTDQLTLVYNITTYVLTIPTLIYRSKKKGKKVVRERLELSTSALSARRSAD